MPEFILDRGTPESAALFAELDPFTQAYIEAAFWTECEPGTCHGEDGNGEPWNPDYHSSLPGDVTFADLHPETLAQMVKDCDEFMHSAAWLDACASLDSLDPDLDGGTDSAQGGHDFWLTRNGHGAGFWDGDWPEPYAARLNETAHSFGEFDLWLGDDGKIYN